MRVSENIDFGGLSGFIFQVLALGFSKYLGQRNMELCRQWDVKLRELYFIIGILFSAAHTVYSIVAGLFLLVVPSLQWKGRYLRVSKRITFHFGRPFNH